jgi:hypothetical protein
VGVSVLVLILGAKLWVIDQCFLATEEVRGGERRVILACFCLRSPKERENKVAKTANFGRCHTRS